MWDSIPVGGKEGRSFVVVPAYVTFGLSSSSGAPTIIASFHTTYLYRLRISPLQLCRSACGAGPPYIAMPACHKDRLAAPGYHRDEYSSSFYTAEQHRSSMISHAHCMAGRLTKVLAQQFTTLSPSAMHSTAMGMVNQNCKRQLPLLRKPLGAPFQNSCALACNVRTV